ncbi:hypothetical protein LSUB1_G003673 [Lachnellula subtilissima]|uniref:Rhodopsin domain-containing protein n=1 Tax=Lachnellula subtilissima TaxID=602034 RepID=A0A8H8UDT1_9HELO|nr:hypothetical protein LSUB1_G003673 [Lachnellula subtilissima]
MNALPPGTDLSTIALAPNPSGAPPNFVDPPSLANAVTGVGITLIIISGIFVILRVIANTKHPRRLGVDDCMYTFGAFHARCHKDFLGRLALVLILRSTNSIALVSQRGTSRHIWDVPLSIVTVNWIKIQATIQIVAAPTIWAAKSAILALYIRLFGTTKWLRLTCYCWIVLMALFYGSNIVIAVVYCIPRKGEAWDGTSFQRCATSGWSAVMIGCFSASADIVIFLLPFSVVLNLKLSPRRRLGLILVFMTGLLLVILSLVSVALRIRVFRGHDPTWNGSGLTIVTYAENFGTVIVSCAPALSAFWFNVIPQSHLWLSLQSTLRLSSWKSRSSRQSSIQNIELEYGSSSHVISRKTDIEVVSDHISVGPARSYYEVGRSEVYQGR